MADRFMRAFMNRDVPPSALLEMTKELDGLPKEEVQKKRDALAKEIEEKYPYRPGRDPDMPGIPLAEVSFTHPAKTNIYLAASKMDVKRDQSIMFNLEGVLNIGDIQKRIDSKYRRCLAGRMTIGFCHDDEYDEATLLKNSVLYRNWFSLKKYLDEGKRLRIWYSEYSEELCGFYQLCELLKKYDQEFSAVRLPNIAVIDGKRKHVFSWNQMSQEAIKEAAKSTRLLSKEEIVMHAKVWEKLRKENAPLRAVIDGRLVSVPEEFYDSWLLKSIPDNEPITIDKALGLYYKYLYSPQSGWLIHRIDELIRQGKIELVEENEYVWRQKIRLVKQVLT